MQDSAFASRIPVILLMVGLFWVPALGADPPIVVEKVEVKGLWHHGAHNAFTDLIRWRDRFYCTFREGYQHVSYDGKIRVLVSEDGETWKPAALFVLPGYDLRDPELEITPDDRLMLLGLVRLEHDPQNSTGSFVSFTEDGWNWSHPQIAVAPGRILWQATWHRGKLYGFSLPAPDGPDCLSFLESSNGTSFRVVAEEAYCKDKPSETHLEFDGDTAYGLVRRVLSLNDEMGRRNNGPVLLVGEPPYTDWSAHELGPWFEPMGGPSMVKTPYGWIAGGRMREDRAERTSRMTLAYLDTEKRSLSKLVHLPSSGDNSYPGMVWHDGILWVSYYSSHRQAQTRIHLAKIWLRAR